MKETDSLIFDLDGTLWDASETVYHAFNDSLGEIGFDITVTPKQVRDFSGLKMDDIFERLLGAVSKDQFDAFVKVYDQKEKDYLRNKGGKLFPNVEKTLEKLAANHRLFIVSNCMAGYIEAFLDFYNFRNYFQDFECFGNANLPKDENIKRIVHRNQLKNPVYIGDTVWDKESCEKAGVDFIYANYGFGTIENAEKKIDSFEDLLKL